MEKEFLSLVDDHKHYMTHVCRVYGRHLDRKDMMQEILAAAWQSFPTFQNRAPFSQWFYGLCRNVCVRHWRKHIQRVEVYTSDVPENVLDYGYEIEYDLELFNFYNQALDGLHPIEKKYMQMYLDGTSFKKMEYITGVDQNTLRVRIHRIKKRLKKKYESKRFFHDD